MNRKVLIKVRERALALPALRTLPHRFSIELDGVHAAQTARAVRSVVREGITLAPKLSLLLQIVHTSPYAGASAARVLVLAFIGDPRWVDSIAKVSIITASSHKKSTFPEAVDGARRSTTANATCEQV